MLQRRHCCLIALPDHTAAVAVAVYTKFRRTIQIRASGSSCDCASRSSSRHHLLPTATSVCADIRPQQQQRQQQMEVASASSSVRSRAGGVTWRAGCVTPVQPESPCGIYLYCCGSCHSRAGSGLSSSIFPINLLQRYYLVKQCLIGGRPVHVVHVIHVIFLETQYGKASVDMCIGCQQHSYDGSNNNPETLSGRSSYF